MSPRRVKRTCAYCGKPDCRCKYRYGRMGSSAIQVSNTSEQTNAGEMKAEFEKLFSGWSDDKPGAWCISFTKYSAEKLAKRKAKVVSA